MTATQRIVGRTDHLTPEMRLLAALVADSLDLARDGDPAALDWLRRCGSSSVRVLLPSLGDDAATLLETFIADPELYRT